MSPVIGIYSFLVLYSILALLYVINVMKRAVNYPFILLLCSNIIACLGYLWYSTAEDVGEGIIGMKLIYFGGIAMLYFMLRLIVSVCKISYPSWIKFLLGALSGLSLYMSMMIGINDSFYKNVEIVKTPGYSYLVKEYGPFHIVHVIVLLMYMFLSLAASLYSLNRPTLISRPMALSLALSEAAAIGIYFVQRIFDIHIELLPFAYYIMLTVDLLIVRKLYLYDADRVAELENEAHGDTGIILFDRNKKYLGSNTVARSLFTEINDYYVECPIPESFGGKAFFENLIDDFVKNGEDNGEPNILERDGKLHKIRVRSLYNSDNHRDLRGYVVSVINDTQAQTYIREIRKMNIDLDRAAKAAEAASEAKSTFLANMSHEIRTPINAVLGLNSIILRDTKEERTKEFAIDIESSGKQLLALVNDILDFSKIEAGKMNIVPNEYQLTSLLNDCQSMLYGRIKEKGLAFSLNCNENAPSVLYGDEVRVRQIIINLLSNAVKYTESGSVSLTADFEKTGDNRIILILSVKDTGSGISEENQKNLFTSFERIDENKHRNIEGTGLGLALVKNLTDLMGGSVYVESAVGEGSTFTVKVPQEVISAAPVGQLASDEKGSFAGKMDDLSDVKGKVLVVDDVSTNLKVFVHLLNKSKLTIDTSLSGSDAVKKASEEKYDIIFLDHMMPEMDGIETLHEIRKNKDGLNANTPAVMLTANAINGVREKYIKEGFDEYLSKPVYFEPLKNIILSYLNNTV